jgi:hypothetical protein
VSQSPEIRISFSRKSNPENPDNNDKKDKTYWQGRWRGHCQIQPDPEQRGRKVLLIHLDLTMPQEVSDPSPQTLQRLGHKLLELVQPKIKGLRYILTPATTVDINKPDWNDPQENTELKSLKYPDWWNHLEFEEKEALLQHTHRQKTQRPALSLGTLLVIKKWIKVEDLPKIKDVYQRNQIKAELEDFESWTKKSNAKPDWKKTDFSKILFQPKNLEKTIEDIIQQPTKGTPETLRLLLDNIAQQWIDGVIPEDEKKAILKIIHTTIKPATVKAGSRILFLSWFEFNKVKPTIANLLHLLDKPEVLHLPEQKTAVFWTARHITLESLLAGNHNTVATMILKVGIPETWLTEEKALNDAYFRFRTSRLAYFDLEKQILENPEWVTAVCKHQTPFGKQIRENIAEKI